MGRPERRETCTWAYDGGESCYQTECGEAFCYQNEEGVKGNGAYYCHHCGGVIRVVSRCFECGVEVPVESSDLCEKCAHEEACDDIP